MTKISKKVDKEPKVKFVIDWGDGTVLDSDISNETYSTIENLLKKINLCPNDYDGCIIYEVVKKYRVVTKTLLEEIK